MCKRKHTARYGIVYFTMMMALYVCAGVYTGIWAYRTADLLTISNTLVADIPSDWSRKPFTELTVTDRDHCPDDYPTTVFKREWLGT